MRTAILASGRGSNLQALINAWNAGNLPIKIVCAGSDQRDAQALQRAEAYGIAVQSFLLQDYENRREQEKAILAWLKSYQTELLLLAGYMKVLSKEFIEEIKIPILNIHPSLLPAFPGLHAQRQAVEYGVKVSGCTVHFVDTGLDSGPIILQEAVPVLSEDTEETLAKRILEAEHRIYPQAVALVANKRVMLQGRRANISPDV